MHNRAIPLLLLGLLAYLGMWIGMELWTGIPNIGAAGVVLVALGLWGGHAIYRKVSSP